MARNTNYPYDPYTGEVPMEPVEDVMTVASVAKDLASPINWLLWKYQYNPFTWSGTKGVSIPIGSKEDFSKALKTFKEGKGFWGKARNVPKAWGQIFRKRRILGEFRDLGTDEEILARRAAQVGKQFRGAVLQRGWGDIYSNWAEKKGFRPLNSISGDLRTMSRTLRATPGMGTDSILYRMGALAENIDINAKNRSERVLARYARMYGKRKGIGAFALKWGIRGMAGLAWVGIGSLMWDVSKMVGEPIGRYLVENANRVGLEFQNRYMPELGGRIAMSYMSSGAATERQRAVEAISRSYINGRSAIGTEARLLHS